MISPSEVIAFQQGASSNKIWPSKFTNYNAGSLYECAYNRYSLTKFGLWAKRELKINDAVHIPAGWIGSDSFVNLMYVGSIDANIYSNGSILFVNNSLPIIKGAVLYRTSAKLPKMDSISGIVHHIGDWGERSDSAENYHLSTFSLVDRAPLTDSLDPIMIEPGAVRDLNPIDSIFPWKVQVKKVDTGTWYGDVTVKSGATLVLHGGYYRIGQLNLEPSSKVEIHFNGKPLYVEVAGNLYTKWGAQFVSLDGGAQGVMWMVHGQEVFLQNDLQEFWGSMIADSAKVSISSYAGLRGQIFAKDIEVHQYNRYLNFIPFTGKPGTDDADSDGLNDSLELAIGTNPNDSDSDGDGLSDGLEYWGRGTASDGHALHRFGAVLDLRNGLYVKENQDTLLNPLRRDVIRRVLWQPDDGYDTLMQFRDALLPALEHIASEFGTGSHYPQLHDTGFIRRGANRTALHFDAGPGFSVNWPNDSSRWGENAVKTWGGAQIVPAGGVDTGVGPYSWDLPRDQMVADDSIVCNTKVTSACYHYAVEKSPDKKMSKTEGDSLIAKMARMHRMSESFDDALF